ncbi:hypothetical protein CMK22_15175 [Candidatus Poribacteria bacterium]|nr:hypothetical protein [Candidatus Poribacteria bacterium]
MDDILAEPLRFENRKIHFTSSGLEIEDESVLGIDQVRTAMMLDTAIDVVNEVRSYLASEQNRLAFTMSNLTGQIQNIEASRSSIQDADFVSETMDLAKAQILSQSSSVMLAQANASIQKVLSLLR